jgi:APA family basic amino acid/polyamine antiporter
MMVVGPRVYYAMAQDGCFFAAAGHVHDRWHTPAQAILFQAAASAVMALTGTFEKLIYYIGFALILFAAMATAGVLRMRRRPGWKKLQIISWYYPVAPLLFVLVSLWMLSYTLFLRPTESLLGLLTVACGGLLYQWKFKKKS